MPQNDTKDGEKWRTAPQNDEEMTLIIHDFQNDEMTLLMTQNDVKHTVTEENDAKYSQITRII